MDEAILRIKLLRLTIRNEAHVSAFWDMGFDVLQDFAHDSFPQSPALVLPEDGDVYNLKEATTVANDSPHAHRA
jgi:hypothetical protein